MHVCMILDPDICMHVRCIYMFLILIHVTMMHICMMHLSMILDPDTYMYDAYINVSRSLTLMHVCMMHISMILDLDPEACMYVWCMYL